MNDPSQNPAAADWAAARGDKWRANVSGMEAMLAPVDEPLIRELRLDAPYRIAEVGCGGGGTTLELRRRAPVGSVVHGFDISPGLVELARRRGPAGDGNLSFEVADMAKATPDEPYDRLVSRFGVMFFDDDAAAFGNLARWLAPGGRFAFAVWGPLPDNASMASARAVVARIVELPAAEPDAPGPFRYGQTGPLSALLERAGLGNLAVRDWQGRLPIGGGLPPAGAARFALEAVGPFGELLAQAGDAAMAEGRRALTEHFANHLHDGVVQMDALVHVLTGARRA